LSLKRRLKRLGNGGGTEPRSAATLREIPGLEAREVVRDEGAFLLHEETFPLTHRHGDIRLEEALTASPRTLALVALEEGMAEWGLDRAIFLDTETTGLSGGAGTYVFLVGVGWFEAGRFRLMQYYMRDHREERAMLAALNERLASFEGLVTFHGKSFDAPRLRDRMRALHLDPSLPLAHHLDLCIVGRRLWRGKHEDGRLQTLEAAECGFHRKDDLPGAECPEAWFSYLRGDGALMARVFEHNRDDILSLVALAAQVARVGEGEGGARERLVHGKLLVKANRREQAEAGFRALLENGPPPWVRRHALRELALVLKHRGDADGAARCWADLRREDPADVTPLIEIAKHLEHRRRDAPGALEITQEALRRVAAVPRTSLREELEHRRRRLERKAAR
jgi:uncharacterized protein